MFCFCPSQQSKKVSFLTGWGYGEFYKLLPPFSQFSISVDVLYWHTGSVLLTAYLCGSACQCHIESLCLGHKLITINPLVKGIETQSLKTLFQEWPGWEESGIKHCHNNKQTQYIYRNKHCYILNWRAYGETKQTVISMQTLGNILLPLIRPIPCRTSMRQSIPTPE